MLEYKSFSENPTSILERESPRECIEIWKNVSFGLILKDKGGNQDCLPFCWF